MDRKQRLEYLKLLHQLHAAAFCCAALAPEKHREFLSATELKVMELVQEVAVPQLTREMEDG